jgi:hypothetical protein
MVRANTPIQAKARAKAPRSNKSRVTIPLTQA